MNVLILNVSRLGNLFLDHAKTAATSQAEGLRFHQECAQILETLREMVRNKDKQDMSWGNAAGMLKSWTKWQSSLPTAVSRWLQEDQRNWQEMQAHMHEMTNALCCHVMHLWVDDFASVDNCRRRLETELSAIVPVQHGVPQMPERNNAESMAIGCWLMSQRTLGVETTAVVDTPCVETTAVVDTPAAVKDEDRTLHNALVAAHKWYSNACLLRVALVQGVTDPVSYTHLRAHET